MNPNITDFGLCLTKALVARSRLCRKTLRCLARRYCVYSTSKTRWFVRLKIELLYAAIALASCDLAPVSLETVLNFMFILDVPDSQAHTTELADAAFSALEDSAKSWVEFIVEQEDGRWLSQFWGELRAKCRLVSTWLATGRSGIASSIRPSSAPQRAGCKGLLTSVAIRRRPPVLLVLM